MPCNNLRGPKLALYAGGDLGTRDSNAVREHLKNCPICRQEAKSLDKTHSMLGQYGSGLSAPPQAPNMLSGIMGRISQMQAPKGKSPQPQGPNVWSAGNGRVNQMQPPKGKGPRSPQG